MRRLATLGLACLLAVGLAPTPARAWDWFRSPNDDVEEGNEALKQGDAEAALQAYDRAASELRGKPAVQLNRGLALSQLGRLDEAREAFDQATRGEASPQVRADAYYNLGRTFMAEADAAAESSGPQAAQAPLRESQDALRQALRHRPGFGDAAYNLELVQRRLVELEEQQRQEQEQEQEQEQSQGQEQGQGQEQDTSEGDAEEERDGEPSSEDTPSEGEPREGDPEANDPPQEGGEDRDGSEESDTPSQPEPAGPEEPSQPGSEETAPDAPPADPGQPDPAEPRPAEGTPQGPDDRPQDGAGNLPQHMQQVLDALQSSEETMQRHQARTRAQQRPRRVEKDW